MPVKCHAMSHSNERPRIAVIFGGRSSEHGVSCLTAREVISVIDQSRFDVTGVGITRSGRWVEEATKWDELETGTLPEVDESLADFSWDRLAGFDVVFPLLHGPWGEDGTLQGLLEMADLRYVGAGVMASAVSMDKPFAKTVFSAAGLPQLPYVAVPSWEWEAHPERIQARVHALGLPVVVKPARAGSSTGVSIVTEWQDLDDAISIARELDPKIVIEAAAVNKREVECGVIQNARGKPIASEVGEIVVKLDDEHDYYDFGAKYLDGTSINVVPADIPPGTKERIRAYALLAFDAVGCEGLARVDFFLTDSVSGGLVINEINTMPGFTPFSMFPKLWQASGIDYAELVENLITRALERPTGLR